MRSGVSLSITVVILVIGVFMVPPAAHAGTLKYVSISTDRSTYDIGDPIHISLFSFDYCSSVIVYVSTPAGNITYNVGPLSGKPFNFGGRNLKTRGYVGNGYGGNLTATGITTVSGTYTVKVVASYPEYAGVPPGPFIGEKSIYVQPSAVAPSPGSAPPYTPKPPEIATPTTSPTTSSEPTLTVTPRAVQAIDYSQLYAVMGLIVVGFLASIGYLTFKPKKKMVQPITATQIIEVTVEVPEVGKTLTLDVEPDHTIKSIIDTVAEGLGFTKEKPYTLILGQTRFGPDIKTITVREAGIKQGDKLTMIS